jgi:ketosteroid isomerase-like protein
MKKLSLFLFVLMVLTSCSSTENAKNQTDQEKAVAAAIEEFKNGIINADRELLSSLVFDELLFSHSSGNIQNKAEFLEEIVSLTPNDYTTINTTEQLIRVVGNTAIVNHIYEATFTSNGAPGTVKIGITYVWKESDGKWKLLARQAYKLPV